jgi:hypothetical protein
MTTVLFTDMHADEEPGGWDRIVRCNPYELANTPRLASRWCKIHSHILFPEAPWTLWADATNLPLVDTGELSAFIEHAEIACFKHPWRHTAKAEAEECLARKLDTEENIKAALRWFEQVRFTDDYGLYGTGCVIRRNSPMVAAINGLWWWACATLTLRDQIALPYVFWTLGVVPSCLEGSPRDMNAKRGIPVTPNPYFEVTTWD